MLYEVLDSYIKSLRLIFLKIILDFNRHKYYFYSFNEILKKKYQFRRNLDFLMAINPSKRNPQRY